MKKIVVLNSGGFDSTTLLLKLSKSNEFEIHSLYFNYGQPNSAFDSKISAENAEKVGAIHHVVDFPRLPWSNSNFYSGDSNEYKSQYLEMRNMIFISYAMSLAESLCATGIYMAILGNGNYADTNRRFLGAVKNLCNNVGVEFETPFAEFEKSELFVLAKELGVGKEYKYISCDTPKFNGEPCGECADCKSLEAYENMLKDNIPVMRFFSSGLDTHDSEFQRLFMENPISEMRVILNNDCQFDCKHCYHHNNPLVGDTLTDYELVNAIKEAYDYGIRSIHYAGKEPLFNERIFTITKKVKQYAPDMVFSVVTNGVNVPKFINELKDGGFNKVFISVSDEFATQNSVTRPNNANKIVKTAIECLNNAGIPVQVFYDLTPDNISHTVTNLRFWRKKYKVKEFHIRTLRLVGGANNIEKLSVESLGDLHAELLKCNLDAHIELNIGACPYTYDILYNVGESTELLSSDISACALSGNNLILPNYALYAELYCSRYEGQITLTADGYVLGCAMECSLTDYNKTSSGNVRNTPIDEIVKRGKEQALKVNEAQSNTEVHFKKCSFNPIDIYD